VIPGRYTRSCYDAQSPMRVILQARRLAGSASHGSFHRPSTPRRDVAGDRVRQPPRSARSPLRGRGRTVRMDGLATSPNVCSHTTDPSGCRSEQRSVGCRVDRRRAGGTGMGLLSDYRKKRQERRRKRRAAQAEAIKSLHDEPSPTRGRPSEKLDS
jgi:hypothetical protein